MKWYTVLDLDKVVDLQHNQWVRQAFLSLKHFLNKNIAITTKSWRWSLTLLLHSLAEPCQRGVVVIDWWSKHCPVNARYNVFYSLSSQARAEINIFKDNWKDEFSVIVGRVELALAVVGVDVLVGDDSNDPFTVFKTMADGAVPVTSGDYVLGVQPNTQSSQHTTRNGTRLL